MKEYCFDTSGFSNPLETIPYDIYGAIWDRVIDVILSGRIAVTTEIYEEMVLIGSEIGDCIRQNKSLLVLEIGGNDWDWASYVQTVNALHVAHRDVISEYTGGSPRTVSMNDISIVALAKSLQLPLVSMEVLVTAPDARKKKIPNICQLEGVVHLSFNDFLRQEGIHL